MIEAIKDSETKDEQVTENYYEIRQTGASTISILNESRSEQKLVKAAIIHQAT